MRGKLLRWLIFGILLIFQLSVCLATEPPDQNDSSKYLDAVRDFANNVLKYGRDTYGPKHTPLFVDGLNIHAHEPVKWISPEGERWILSNLASQQDLFRTLDGPTTAQTLKAFPSAEGYGAYAKGGRGGRVIEVTNRNDDGPGSFRAAVMATGPRIVVFRVSGTIVLQSQLYPNKDNSYLTIAGQTAPGDGIQLKGAAFGLRYGIHDVIVRHLRVRPGPLPQDTSYDGFVVGGDITSDVTCNIIVDHCSVYWAQDEGISVSNNAEDVTFQWCISVGLKHDLPGHKAEQSKTALFSAKLGYGQTIRRVTLHHSYLANSEARNPRTSADGPFHFINNLIYNWAHYAGDMRNRGNGVKANWIGNYFKAGPLKKNNNYEININPEGYAHDDNFLYVEDNLGPHRRNSNKDEWEIVGYNYRNPAPKQYQRSAPWPDSPVPVTVDAAKDVPRVVLANVGATAPVRDELDRHTINDYCQNTGTVKTSTAIIDSDWPALRSGTAPTDTDHDGMPDDWEVLHGLDPGYAGDGVRAASNGYTNVENYLNGLAGDNISPGGPQRASRQI